MHAHHLYFASIAEADIFEATFVTVRLSVFESKHVQSETKYPEHVIEKCEIAPCNLNHHSTTYTFQPDFLLVDMCRIIASTAKAIHTWAV